MSDIIDLKHNLDQKDVLGYEQPLEKEAIHSKAFLKEMIQQVVKDASKSEASFIVRIY